MLKRPATPALPKRAASLSEVSPRVRPLYEIDYANSDDTIAPYRLNAAGTLLARVRAHVAQGDGSALSLSRPARLTTAEFSTALAIASPNERPILIRAAAAGTVKVGG